MTQFDWNPDKGEATFETSLISGIVIADGNRFTLSNLIWKPGDVQIDRGMALAPYRLLARSSWMGEVREMSHSVRPIDDGLVVRFEPTHDHRATLTCMVRITQADTIDFTVDVTSHDHYPDYELMMSSYFAEGFRPGGYIGPGVRGGAFPPQQVMPVENPVYQDMYVAFPRDERSAAIISDGRWQRGRHFTRFVAGRYYGLPLAFYTHGVSDLDILLMGQAPDVFAVAMAYHSDDPSDDVGQHRSMYLSLFGRDLHPGERIRTTCRMQLGLFGRRPDSHEAAHREFAERYPGGEYLDIES